MRYSKEQLESIEKVRGVFADYIANSKYLDLLWSDKIGYILIVDIREDMKTIDSQPVIISDGAFLCEQMLFDIAYDTLESVGPVHYIYETSPSEQQLIKDACYPYMEQLPEYGDLIDRLFVDPDER